MGTEDKKSLDQRIDDHNRGRLHSSENDSNDRGMSTDERPSETHNAVSHPANDNWGENRVSTSLDDE